MRQHGFHSFNGSGREDKATPDSPVSLGAVDAGCCSGDAGLGYLVGRTVADRIGAHL